MANINYSKVESVNVNHGFEVTYKSGAKRLYPVEDIKAEIRRALDAGLPVYGELPEGFVPKDQVIKFDQNQTATVMFDENGKVIHLEQLVPPEGAVWCQWCGESPALAGEPCEACRKLGAAPELAEEQGAAKPATAEAPATILANLIGLNEAQAKLLAGATRLNFWRNGHLNIQVQHGAKSVKIACTKSPADVDIVALLAKAWGWSKLDENRLYFRPSKEARVTL